MMRTYLAALTLLILQSCLSGCIAQQPIERAIERVMTVVIAPAIQDALSETVTQGLTTGGNIQGISPGYRADFEALWVIGAKGSVTVQAIGVAGNLDWDTQAATSQPSEVGP